MPIPASDHSDAVFREAMDTAHREGPVLVKRALDSAVRVLGQASVAATMPMERARLGDAGSMLMKGTQAIVEAFPDMLTEEIGVPGSYTRSKGKNFSFDSLELMSEDQLDDKVDRVRGQNEVSGVVEAELVRLNALMTSLRGHEQVQASTNPLRPEVWVKALHRALGRGGGDPAMRAMWMQHACAAFGPELGGLYRRIADGMLQQGVAAATLGVSAPKHEERRKAQAAQLTLRDLKHLLLSASRSPDDTHGTTRPGETINGMTMPAAMEALEGMSKFDDVLRRMQDRFHSGVWHAERAAEDAGVDSIEYTPTQTLAREVARQMVQNIAADARLLPDIQHLVRKLEPPLLHLAVHDQRFFTDRRHPARQLVEEITQRSLAWTRESASGFQDFIDPLNEAVQLLSGMPVRDAEPFDFTLHTLRESWRESEERARRQRASVARALIKADARNHAATSIAAELRDRPDIASASLVVRRFLLGPWAQVVASARLESPGTKDPGGWEALINDIVWSSQARLAGQNPSRLERISAPLIDRIKQGLHSIGASGPEVGTFLVSFEAAHQKALRGEESDTRPHNAPVEEGDMLEWQADALPWLSPDEVQDSKLMSPTDFSSTLREVPMPESGLAQVSELAAGGYIEVSVDGVWVRWKLAWASPHGTMLMFTDAGGKPESITRQMLARMFDSGHARVLDNASLVESALDALAQAALEFSSHEPPK